MIEYHNFTMICTLLLSLMFINLIDTAFVGFLEYIYIMCFLYPYMYIIQVHDLLILHSLSFIFFYISYFSIAFLKTKNLYIQSSWTRLHIHMCLYVCISTSDCDIHISVSSLTSIKLYKNTLIFHFIVCLFVIDFLLFVPVLETEWIGSFTFYLS